MIRTAYKHWNKDSPLFRKWFGNVDDHSDENVRIRFKRAMDMMFA
jgi:hypothetical protein